MVAVPLSRKVNTILFHFCAFLVHLFYLLLATMTILLHLFYIHSAFIEPPITSSDSSATMQLLYSNHGALLKIVLPLYSLVQCALCIVFGVLKIDVYFKLYFSCQYVSFVCRYGRNTIIMN